MQDQPGVTRLLGRDILHTVSIGEQKSRFFVVSIIFDSGVGADVLDC